MNQPQYEPSIFLFTLENHGEGSHTHNQTVIYSNTLWFTKVISCWKWKHILTKDKQRDLENNYSHYLGKSIMIFNKSA